MREITLDAQLELFYSNKLPTFCLKPLAEKLNAKILHFEHAATMLRSVGNNTGANHCQEKALCHKLDLITVLVETEKW